MPIPLSEIKFPFVRPQIPPVEQWSSFLKEAYRRQYFTNFGPAEQLLSERIRERFASPQSCCVLSCNATVGLSAALLALDIKGRVLLPAFTFPATLQAVVAAGCQPIICDVDPTTWELSPAAVEAEIDANGVPAGLMPVRPFGFVRPMSSLLEIARKHRLPMVIDSAAAIGRSTIETSREGVTVIEVFSLHATKTFGIGEGGAIIAPGALKDRLRSALNFGIRPDRSFGMGFNGKMSEIQAAVGLSVLDILENMIKRRSDMYGFYRQFVLQETQATIAADEGPTPFSNFPILLPEHVDAGKLEADALDVGVQTRRYYRPSLSTDAPAFLGIDKGCSVSVDLANRMLCLPLYPDATNEEQAEIARRLRRLCRTHGFSA